MNNILAGSESAWEAVAKARKAWETALNSIYDETIEYEEDDLEHLAILAFYTVPDGGRYLVGKFTSSQFWVF